MEINRIVLLIGLLCALLALYFTWQRGIPTRLAVLTLFIIFAFTGAYVAEQGDEWLDKPESTFQTER